MKEIGKGSFGKVKLVYDTDDNNKPYAMKTVKKRKKLKGFMRPPPGVGGGSGPTNLINEEVMQEIAIMKKLVSRYKNALI